MLSKPLSMFGLRARPRSALIASKVRQIQNLVLPDSPGMSLALFNEGPGAPI